jgi:hypothetical protein
MNLASGFQRPQPLGSVWPSCPICADALRLVRVGRAGVWGVVQRSMLIAIVQREEARSVGWEWKAGSAWARVHEAYMNVRERTWACQP